jgi:hypothetical protein
MRRYHAQNVSSHSFQVGDFVLRKIQTTKERHKLSPTWEGPLEIVEVTVGDHKTSILCTNMSSKYMK